MGIKPIHQNGLGGDFFISVSWISKKQIHGITYEINYILASLVLYEINSVQF